MVDSLRSKLDDAYGCNNTFALPVLRRLGIPAPFFVSSEFVDSQKAFPTTWPAAMPSFRTSRRRSFATWRVIRSSRSDPTHLGYERVNSFFGGSNRVAPDRRIAFGRNRLGPERFAPAFVLALCEGYEGRSSFSLRRRREPSTLADFQPSGF